MSFTQAVVRRPSPNFADGITTADSGSPDFTLSKAQHERYCAALQHAGLRLTRIASDERYPDGCFVEDTALVTKAGAILARPGAEVRQGEVDSVRESLLELTPSVGEIEAPGTLDGGDVCDAGGRYTIGVTGRTNEAGATQLAAILKRLGHASTIVDLRKIPGLLHLKSGFAYLGDGRYAAIAPLARLTAFKGLKFVEPAADEAYAANALRVNDDLLIAAGCPGFEAKLSKLGYRVVVLEMSEFRKMDGGLSCLSLRF